MTRFHQMEVKFLEKKVLFLIFREKQIYWLDDPFMNDLFIITYVFSSLQKKKITFVIGRITFPQPLTDVHVPRTFECVTLHGGGGINFADGIKIANQLI